MPNRILSVVFLLVTIGLCRNTSADDSATRAVINALKQTVAELENRIATLEASLDDADESESFAWDLIGTQLRPSDPSVIEAFNDANKTQYRGAVTVTDVHPGSAASTGGIKRGDLLLGIDEWQTPDLTDLKIIASRHKQLAASGKTKFVIVRNGQTLEGYVELPKP